MIDLERIKTEIPIESLIAQSGLTLAGAGHTLTTVEHDSLKIFTRNNSWAWYSQAGRNGKTLGGSVIDWYMHANQCSKADAIRALSAMLDAGAVVSMPRPEVDRRPQAPAMTWQSPDWQRKALQQLERAQIRLWDRPDDLTESGGDLAGEPGRAYLAQRAIRPDMWIAFGLGYGDAFNIKAGRFMPALWLPWQNRRLTAVQYRFIGVDKDDKDADRFGQAKGGERLLFGLQHCMEAGPRELQTLFLVEGELNAISIFQSAYGLYPVDVASFGPRSNIGAHNKDMIAKVASRYRNVVVWADEPQDALAALGAVPGALPLQSPEIDGKRRDANDLLQMRLLDKLIFDILLHLKRG